MRSSLGEDTYSRSVCSAGGFPECRLDASLDPENDDYCSKNTSEIVLESAGSSCTVIAFNVTNKVGSLKSIAAPKLLD